MNLSRRSESPTVLFPAQAQWTGVPPTFGDLQLIAYIFDKKTLRKCLKVYTNPFVVESTKAKLCLRLI